MASLVPLNLVSTSGVSRQPAHARHGIVLSLTKADGSAPLRDPLEGRASGPEDCKIAAHDRRFPSGTV